VLTGGKKKADKRSLLRGGKRKSVGMGEKKRGLSISLDLEKRGRLAQKKASARLGKGEE